MSLMKNRILMILFCSVNLISASEWQNVGAYKCKKISILPIVYKDAHDEIQVILKYMEDNKKGDFRIREIGKILELSPNDITDFIKKHIKGCIIMAREDNTKEESYRDYSVTYIVDFDSINAARLLTVLGKRGTFVFWNNLLKSVSNNNNALELQSTLAHIMNGIKPENKNKCDNNLPLGLYIFGIQKNEGQHFFYQKHADILLMPEEIEIFCQKIHNLLSSKRVLIPAPQEMVSEKQPVQAEKKPKNPKKEIVINEREMRGTTFEVPPRSQSQQEKEENILLSKKSIEKKPGTISEPGFFFNLWNSFWRWLGY